MFEYIGKCLKCTHHTLLATKRAIKRPKKRNARREGKCTHCHKTTKISVIGSIIKTTEKAITIHFWQ